MKKGFKINNFRAELNLNTLICQKTKRRCKRKVRNTEFLCDLKVGGYVADLQGKSDTCLNRRFSHILACL
ncbi:MAG: hypothetical protein B6U86_01200 [Candidatus Altiarchaeales archaeon ex4484_43]|nr:MAG: hypothetical protein B6U86_01200 [Candidatus Altiarchaeales archaeon ex4484_43]